MQGVYLHPVGIVHGGAARIAMDEGAALPLAGGPLGFTHALIIEGVPGRTRSRLASPGDLKASAEPALQALLARLTGPRAPIAGLDVSGRPLIMGIVNVTPDSFSDGGLNADPANAIAAGRALHVAGANILDIGGESTRPGSDPVPLEVERARVMPVITALANVGAVLSVDTRKAALMEAAVAAGAAIVNDVSALGHDPQAPTIVARSGAVAVLMHARGEPKVMQQDTRYADVVLEVYDALARSIKAAEQAGIERTRIVADPGIGFGKSFAQNLELLERFAIFHGLGVPLMAGASRKAFIGHVTGVAEAGRRVSGSIGAALAAAARGAQVLRVHDVAETRQALDVWCAASEPHAEPA